MKFDTPISSPQDDILGRRPAAEHLIQQVLRTLTDEESAAIGIVAPWGWGKTSFLRLMESAVANLPNEQQADRPSRPPVVLWFHPWWYTSRTDLYEQFYREISSQADEQLKRWSKVGLAKVLGDLAGAVSSFAGGQAVGDLVTALAGLATKEIDKQKEAATSLRKLRDITAEHLRDSGFQLWIFIDDVDRMDPEGAIDFFALIRSMADLPWTRYFIAYDSESLRTLLGGALLRGRSAPSGDGKTALEAYVSKFIQIEVDAVRITDQVQSNEWANADGYDLFDAIAASLEEEVPIDDKSVTEAIGRLARAFLYGAASKDAHALERIAWIRTYISVCLLDRGVSTTPRDFVRSANRMYMHLAFDNRLVIDALAWITVTVRSGSALDWIIGKEGEHVAGWIYESVAAFRDDRDLLGRQLVNRFLSAWAERVVVARGEETRPELEFIEQSIKDEHLFVRDRP
jgi:KAP family P-loop domain